LTWRDYLVSIHLVSYLNPQLTLLISLSKEYIVRVSYTLAEINTSNKLNNIFLIETGTKIKIPENFKTLQEAASYFEKELEGQNHIINVALNTTHVIFVINDDMVIETLDVLTKHVSAIVGFIAAIKGILKMYKSSLSYVKEDFEKLTQKYGKFK